MMDYEEWKEQVPACLKEDALWQFDAYRKALFLFDLTWADCELLKGDLRGRVIWSQLIRSAGSISANMEEGYGRGFSKDRDHYLRIALGSARETRGWFFRCRHIISRDMLDQRIKHSSEIIALLITEIQKKRRVTKGK